MNRWWSNGQDSIAALNVVDDSDVVNGVGVAVLGYHGLSKSLLEPLATQTLVDVHRVREALSGVDLEPVSKALSEATKPVMGGASEKYGQLLAEAIHKRAVESTERLLLSWTNTGMPWPQAIEKAAEVHGVPLERLGRYASVMKAAGITPLVRADYADRELMAYAAHIGHLESVTDSTFVVKQDKVKFNEEDHPRSPNGEFKDKNATVSQISDKTKRLERFNRLNNLNNMNRANLASIKSKATSVKEIPKEELKQETINSVQIKSERIANPKLRMETLKNALVPSGPKEPTESDFPNEGEIHRWAEEIYIPIGREVLEDISINYKGLFFAGQLKHSLEAVNKKHLHDFIGTEFGGIEEFNKKGMALLKCTETPVIKETMENATGSHYENINKDTDYAVVSKKAKFSVRKGLEFVDIADPSDRHADTEPYQVTFISLENADFSEFSKNLQGNNLQQFNEDHPRGNDGRFADKTNIVDLKQQRLDRFNRINNLNNLNNQNRAAQMKRLVEAQKEVQSKVEIARERLQERPIAGKRIKGETIRSETLSANNPTPKTDIELNNKWVMVFGFDAPNIGESPELVANRVRDNLLDSDELSHSSNNPSNLVAVRPFINNALDNTDGIVSGEDNGFDRLINYVDAYRYEKGWEGELTDFAFEEFTHKKLLVDADLTIPEIIDLLPARKINGDSAIWQPQMFKKAGTDLSEIAWVGHNKEDDIQVVLGTQDEFQALKNGNATITKVDEVHSLMDLMTSAKIDGKNEDIFDAFDKTSEAGNASIGTNPPVSAYVVKIGNNGK